LCDLVIVLFAATQPMMYQQEMERNCPIITGPHTYVSNAKLEPT
jgi:hypothetical protein